MAVQVRHISRPCRLMVRRCPPQCCANCGVAGLPAAYYRRHPLFGDYCSACHSYSSSHGGRARPQPLWERQRHRMLEALDPNALRCAHCGRLPKGAWLGGRAQQQPSWELQHDGSPCMQCSHMLQTMAGLHLVTPSLQHTRLCLAACCRGRAVPQVPPPPQRQAALWHVPPLRLEERRPDAALGAGGSRPSHARPRWRASPAAA